MERLEGREGLVVLRTVIGALGSPSQPGPGGLLELVEHPVDVLVAWPVLRRPGDHARRVLVLELQRVGHRGHGVRIAAQDRHVVPDLALAVQLAREVVSPAWAEPVPCASFPDDYTLIPYRGKPAADGPRYKSIGNAIGVPVLRWIGERIAIADEVFSSRRREE